VSEANLNDSGTADEDMSDKSRRLGEAMIAYQRDGKAALDKACVAHPDLAAELHHAATALDFLRGAAGESTERSGAISASAGSLDIGSEVGHFRIEELLGQGGMGRVFRALDLELNRPVALKVISIPFLSNDEALTRIRREARLLAQVRHDNIVRVHEVGQTKDGVPYFVMDLIEGAPLSVLIGKLSGRNPADLEGADLLDGILEAAPSTSSAIPYPTAVAQLLLPIANALEQAHRLGLVHSDVKPSNILVDRQGRPHLMDFGIARELDSVSLSTTGHGAGTPSYMAPEQIAGVHRGGITAATDVYALGVTLYQALTLRLPFEAESATKTYWQILNMEPLQPRALNPAIEIDLETICRAAIEKEPRHRYASAADLADDLRNYLDLRPIRRSPPGPLRKLQRFTQRNPWPVTAAIACCLALAIASYTIMATQATRRVAQLKEQAYGLVGSSNADLDALGKAVTELVRLAPQDLDVRAIKEGLDEKLVIQTIDKAREDALMRLAQASSLSRSDDAADQARVSSSYFDCLQIVNESLMVAPGWTGWEGPFAQAYSFRKAWLDTQSALSFASVGSAAPGSATAELLLDGGPAGADVYLFRYRLQSELQPDGEPRLVPVPLRYKSTGSPDGDGTRPGFEAANVAIRPGSDVLVVEAVAANSPAARAGILRGDLVSDVAGRPVDASVLVLSSGTSSGHATPAARALSQLVRLGDSSIRDQFDLDFVRDRTSEGAELVAEVLEPFSEAQAARTVTVRRTRGGFEPELGSVREALAGALPPEGVELVVSSGARSRSVHLEGGGPSGLTLLTTCYPLVIDELNSVGALPLPLHEVPPGSYLLVMRKSGYEDLRIPVALAGGRTTRLRADLIPEGTTPAGFVRVPGGPYLAGVVAGQMPADIPAWPSEERWLDGFWIGRTEITVAEYLEFLDDASTQKTIAEGERTRTYARIPRTAVNDRLVGAIYQPIWAKRDGRYVSAWSPKQPVVAISCEDADAYCRWRTRVSGSGWIFRLPTEDEWEKAARGADGRTCPWGDQLELRFVKCTAAHGGAVSSRDATEFLCFEQVDRPTRDESPFGMRDAAGNVLEWCVGTGYRKVPFLRPWRGGFFWSESTSSLLSARRADGYPHRPSTNDGFRIVAWKRPEP